MREGVVRFGCDGVGELLVGQVGLQGRGMRGCLLYTSQVLAPYAMAWRIIARPSDTVLPAEVRSRLEGWDDYRSHECKLVAMWALVNSYRGLGDADLSPFVVRASRIARTTATLESLGAHDERRLLEILTALEQVTGIRTLNRTGALERRLSLIHI